MVLWAVSDQRKGKSASTGIMAAAAAKRSELEEVAAIPSRTAKN
jgi:hypothetical protein